MRTRSLALALACVVAASPAARADADDHVAEAEAHVAAKRFEEAATAYAAAYAEDPQPKYLCNIGVAFHRARDLSRAQAYLSDCVIRGAALDARFISTVRDTLDTVEAQLRVGNYTPVDILVSPKSAEVTVLGETFVGSRVLWLPYGTHDVTAKADGYETQRRTVDAIDHSQRNLQIALARARVVEPVTVARSKRPAVVATATTGALALAAVLVYLRARGLAGDVDPMVPRPAYDDAVDRARRWQHASWALAGLAGAGALVTGYLWMRSTTRVEVTPTEGGGGTVGLAGSW